jgi:hypothetical protein
MMINRSRDREDVRHFCEKLRLQALAHGENKAWTWFTNSFWRGRFGYEFPDCECRYAYYKSAYNLIGVGIFSYVVFDAPEHSLSSFKVEHIHSRDNDMFWQATLCLILRHPEATLPTSLLVGYERTGIRFIPFENRPIGQPKLHNAM